uniref:Odorant binding protein n=1 Tax=Lissorhoptrus oryzophilus TaxID=308863 RepID=A0A0B4KZC9_9CUCU|nr:odorant binding protein [Lissorhoptrus oryzophilus]
MRTLCLVLCFTVVVVSAGAGHQRFREKWNSVHSECQAETFVDEAIFESIRKGGNPDLPSNFGLHAFCMLKKLGFQDSNGQPVVNHIRGAVKHNVDSAKVDQVVSECAVSKGSSEQTALHIFGCFSRNNVNIGQK